MKKTVYYLSLLLLLVACVSATDDNPAINETLNTIFNRKSVRTYTSKPLEEKQLDILVRAGMAAPSSRDIRPWEFVVITDKALLEEMAEALPLAAMLAHTQQAIVVCGDSEKSENCWYLDCSAASQNILLAAESMGIGAVWTAAFPYSDRVEAVQRLLQLPAHIIPLNVIPLGYPGGDEEAVDKYDRARIHYNRY